MIEVNTDDGEEHSSHAIDIVIYYRAEFYNILDTAIMHFKQRLSKGTMNFADGVGVFLMFDYSKSLIYFEPL